MPPFRPGGGGSHFRAAGQAALRSIPSLSSCLLLALLIILATISGQASSGRLAHDQPGPGPLTPLSEAQLWAQRAGHGSVRSSASPSEVSFPAWLPGPAPDLAYARPTSSSAEDAVDCSAFGELQRPASGPGSARIFVGMTFSSELEARAR